jgi:hypothetical protein
VTVTHPTGVLPEANGSRHGLISFNASEFRKNLEFLLEQCEQLGRPTRFVTIAELERSFRGSSGLNCDHSHY